MSILDAPAYNERRENLKKNLFIGSGVALLLIVVVALAGIITAHGWFFSNLGAEHRINKFLTAVEQKNFNTAYGIYQNDKDWQQHPDKYSAYPLQRFTEDWTTYSPANEIIVSHKVEKSIVDGSGPFGTGVIVAATVNGKKRIFIWYERKDGTLTYPTPHIFDPGSAF